MNVLTITTLFPNSAMPGHGVFVENRLRHLAASGKVSLRVVAPVPWLPLLGSRCAGYAAFARAPRAEKRHGIAVTHPRYVLAPGNMLWAPLSLYRCLAGHVGRLLRDGLRIDLIDAHYFYPDGVAAAWLARRLGRPLTITARGTDLNLIPQYRLPRRLIRGAAASADGLITVCQALKDTLVGLGTPADKVTVLRNGVDLGLFVPPVDRAAARRDLGLTRPTLVSVGHLIERKAHDLVVRAMAALPDMDLLVVGDGPERPALAALAAQPAVAGRVRLTGAVPHDRLPALYGAADALVLASSREGWANVLLEAMACGTPVVASNVWGTPEVVATPAAGVLMDERTPAGIAQAVQRLFTDPPARGATRAYAEQFSWDATTLGQLDLFTEILARRSGGG